MTEHEIMNQIQKELSPYGIVIRMNPGVFQTQDGRYIKSGPPPGTPDLQFIGQGYVVFFEVKKPGGRVSQQQKKFIARMQELEHRAEVVYSASEALGIVKGIIEDGGK